MKFEIKRNGVTSPCLTFITLYGILMHGQKMVLSIVIIFFIVIIVYDFIGIVKEKDWKIILIYSICLLFSFTIIFLKSLNVLIPSITKQIVEIINSIVIPG